MRRLILLLIVPFMISVAYALCDYNPDLLDWTGKQAVNLNYGWLPEDIDDNPLYIGANITEVYVSLGIENLYFNFEISESAQLNDNFMYVLKLYPHMSYIEYYEVWMRCSDIIGVLEKPYAGARINWTANVDWPSIKADFEAAAHPNSLELAFPLDFFDDQIGDDIDFQFLVYNDEGYMITDVWTSGSVDLCSSTGLVCGDDICEGEENHTIHPCTCPNDCPGIELICIDAHCGNRDCEKGEATIGSPCECPDDCPIGIPCDIGEPIIDWLGATTLSTSTREPWERINGSDLVALKAKVDTEKIYLKIELESDESPHENITYAVRINPWVGGVDYITLRFRCDNLYELIEKVHQYQSPTNHTSNPAWSTIKSYFQVSTTEHAVEIAMPWSLFYYSSGTGIEVRSYYGSDEIDDISSDLDNIVSLFISNCGDGTCSDEESDPNNRYQFCQQDCPNAPQPLCGNGICDIGEDDRWATSQCVWDCPAAFEWMDNAGGPGPSEPEKFEDIIGGIITVVVISVVLIGAVFGGRRLYRKATAGRRKLSDMQKRITQIKTEKKDLQKKYMATRISEVDFREKMQSLDREYQNLDLELKEKKKKK